MGYTTYFSGEWEVIPPLQPEHRDYLRKFAQTRRMARVEETTKELPDPLREAVGLPIGTDGAYYVGSDAPFGQDYDGATVLDSNSAPGATISGLAVNRRAITDKEKDAARAAGHMVYQDEIGDPCPGERPHAEHGCKYAVLRLPKPDNQPGLWCQWTPNEDGTFIEWDEGEKFYDYVSWIAYLLEHFLAPWGYQLDGTVMWDGEESGDLGGIECEPIDDGGTKVTILQPGPMVATNHAVIG